jgi:hypothetical protein
MAASLSIGEDYPISRDDQSHMEIFIPARGIAILAALNRTTEEKTE